MGCAILRTTATASSFLLMLSGCTAAPPVAAPEPTPYLLTESEIESWATLLMLEDQRDYDSEQFSALATSSFSSVRLRTALVLGRLGERQALPALKTLLQDPDTAVAATAAFALGLLGDSAAVPALVHAAGGNAPSTRPSVAAEALTALGEIGTDAGAEAIRNVLGDLELDNPITAPVANAGLLAIWKFPRPADLLPITRWTVAEEAETRWRAIYALVRRNTPSATQLLLESVHDPDERVRALAIRGLSAENVDSAGLARPEVLSVVAAATNDTAYSARINAVRTLGTYSGHAATSHLIDAVASADPHLRLAAVESLGQIGAQANAAAQPLRALVARQSEPVAIRAAAILALSRISPAAGRTVAQQSAAVGDWRIRAAAARALANATESDSVLVRLMHDRDGRVAAAAVGAVISTYADSLQRFRPLLIGLLGDDDIMVRASALNGLSRIAEPAFLPLFLDAYERALEDEQNDAALAAVDAIASLAETGFTPRRAFFARFQRSADHLIRRRVQEHFGVLPEAWGAVRPTETRRSRGYYQDVVRQWIVPALASGEKPHVTISTGKGDLEISLFPIAAPLTVLNFVSLAEAEYFDGQRWPRVVPNFVVQGGDPRGDMSGGPGYAIRDELNRHPYLAGTLGMALSGQDTGGSQFFITHSAQPHLDGGYTVFGQLLKGEEVARRLLPGDEILTVRLTSVPSCMICTEEISP